jgi:hypothetical protein
MVGATQQTRTSAFFKPFAIMMTLALAVYTLVLPQLSSFVGLGLTLFMCAFVARYFFSGLAQLAGMVSIIMIISVQNQQSYDFAAQANTLVYVLLAFLLVYAMSYLLGSARPEKVVLKMTKRFFRSAQFIISHIIRERNDKPSWPERWKLAYYRQEMATLPAKLEAWGKSIDSRLFPNTSQEQIGQLVTSLRSLVYRFEELLLVRQSKQAEELQFNADLGKWAEELEYSFRRWSEQPDASENKRREQQIKARLPAFERRTEEFLMRLDDGTPEDARENLYRFLGGFRGLSQATLNYAQVRHHVDWDQWREERFS